ncbi:MAG: hypothetical protein ACI4TX_00295 [Christensenellales bacterium]
MKTESNVNDMQLSKKEKRKLSKLLSKIKKKNKDNNPLCNERCDSNQCELPLNKRYDSQQCECVSESEHLSECADVDNCEPASNCESGGEFVGNYTRNERIGKSECVSGCESVSECEGVNCGELMSERVCNERCDSNQCKLPFNERCDSNQCEFVSESEHLSECDDVDNCETESDCESEGEFVSNYTGNERIDKHKDNKQNVSNKNASNKKDKKKDKKQEHSKDVIKREKSIRKQKAQELGEIRERWYKLDNSALIYPAICNDEWNSVFRISAIMKEPVNKDKLQEALDLTIDRFPFFNVSLKEGLFWHYFQALTEKPKVQEEIENPCRPFIFKKNAHILRVLYYNTKISFEIFHSLSDGYGAIQFFNVLIITYLELMGIEVKDKSDFGYNAYDKPTSEEGEDSFKRYYKKSTIRSRTEKKAYAIEDEYLGNEQLRVFNGTTSVKAVKEIAKKYNATLNEFLASVYLCTLLEHKRLYGKGSKKPVKLSIPVNIRRHLPSKTMRNFALVLNIEIPLDKEDAPFEEIIEIVKNEMLNLTEDYVYGFIGKNVQSEKNFFVRIIPLFIKKPIMRLVYSQVGEILFTSTLTNVGLNKLPNAVIENVESYQCVLGATKLNRLNLAVISVGDTLCITLSSRLKENTLARDFFKRLASFDLNINIQSNF